jgi:hypothetical protein
MINKYITAIKRDKHLQVLMGVVAMYFVVGILLALYAKGII